MMRCREESIGFEIARKISWGKIEGESGSVENVINNKRGLAVKNEKKPKK